MNDDVMHAMRWACLALAVSLAGCASAPKPMWTSPDTELPLQWSTTLAPTRQTTPWWSRYGDAQLGAVMTQAQRANGDLAAAALRVRSAQALAGLTATNSEPGVGGSANVNRSRDLRAGRSFSGSTASALLSYEVDLWGKLASQRDAAQWAAQATVSDCQAAALSLSGTVATLYWQLAQLNQLVTLGEAEIAYALKTRDVIQAKFEAGAVSGLLRAQAGVNLANQRAAQTQLVQRRTETRHALAALLALPPNAPLSELPALPDGSLPPVEARLPAEVLANRPDVHAAEIRLRESFSNLEVTRRNFYPSFSLTGALGGASTALLGFAQNPVATLGAGLSMPFLRWDTVKLSVKVSELQYEEAVASFRQRLFNALTEVEDALSAREQLMAEHEELTVARDHSAQAAAMTETRFKSGVAEFQVWLDAQQVLRNADRSLAYNRFNQLSNEVRLYKALGAAHGADGQSCTAY